MVRRVIPCTSCHTRFVSYGHVQTECMDCVAANNKQKSPPDPRKIDAADAFDIYYSDDDDDDDDTPLVNLCQSNVMRHHGSVDEHGSEAGEEKDVCLKEGIVSNHDVQACSIEYQGLQQQLHAQSTLQEEATAQPASLSLQPRNAFETCLVCGKSLSHIQTGYKGRLSHVKRCSKQHGASLKDYKFNDEEELFDAEENTTNMSSTSSVNPYQKKNQWHGGGSQVKEKAPTINEILMAGARRAAKMKQLKKQPSKKRPRHSSHPWAHQGSYSNCPFYKKIPGTDFCVDGFQYASPQLTKNYFLTHFHADHYGGITKSWSAGIIYCSFPTANLVCSQLGVDRRFVHPLPTTTPTVVESKGKAVTITLLHANHCPGAVMFLFQVGNRAILHVGDFRWNYDIMSKQPALAPYCRPPWCHGTSRQRIDDIFLDTTYCDDQYDLPTQAVCIEACVQQALNEVQRAQVERKRLVMVFGAYTIGKEAVYMAVAKRLKLKVYVDKRRFRILSQFDWAADEMALLTTNQAESILWVVPLGTVNLKKLSDYQSVRTKQFARDFDVVVGFRPTGWSHSSKKSKTDVLSTQKRGNLTVHSVPYSEHSSFPELIECIECLNPKGRIIPTVSASKSQQQVDLLLSYWRDKKANLI